jgi:hypothetical protein
MPGIDSNASRATSAVLLNLACDGDGTWTSVRVPGNATIATASEVAQHRANRIVTDERRPTHGSIDANDNPARSSARLGSTTVEAVEVSGTDESRFGEADWRAVPHGVVGVESVILDVSAGECRLIGSVSRVLVSAAIECSER